MRVKWDVSVTTMGFKPRKLEGNQCTIHKQEDWRANDLATPEGGRKWQILNTTLKGRWSKQIKKKKWG